MATPRHKGGTKTFPELDFAEQAKSVSASIINLQRSIEARCRHPEATAETRIKCINQVSRLLERLSKSA